MQFVDLKKQYLKYKDEIDKEIAEVIDQSSFIMGPKVSELETKLAKFVNVTYAIGVSSGTDALLFCLMALDIKEGDEVITTPFTFIATGEVIRLLGAVPVFADIDPVTYNITPEKISKAITKKTKAIIPVSLYGQCADLKKINSIAKDAKIPVIEDGCQSFGAETEQGKSCGISAMGCTSFFPSKLLGCYGDGGMIFTNDDKLADKIKKIRVHGQEKRYHHVMLGTNGRLDTIQAAVLLAKLPYFEEEIKMRQKVGEYYYRQFSKIKGIIAPKTLPHYTHVYAQFSIQVERRDTLAKYLQENGIPTAVHYPVPLHLQPVFSGLGYKEGLFPVSETVAKKIISLPMHPFLTEEEQNFVVEKVKEGISV